MGAQAWMAAVGKLKLEIRTLNGKMERGTASGRFC